MSHSVLDQLRAQREGVVLVRPGTSEADVIEVGSYARISDAYESKETGVTEDGVNRQLKANEHIAQARSLHIKKVYIDNSVSAYKKNVVRDDFEALLEDLESGFIQGIICYNLDRFARQVKDLERAIDIYDAGRASKRNMVFATAEGDLNLASDDGITIARVMVAFANKSSRDTARRVRAKHQESRDSGRHVGGHRPFGWMWRRDMLPGIDGMEYEGKRYHVKHPEEAAEIERAARGLTDGSLTWNALVRDWNERGITTPRGTPWRQQTVKMVMRSPRLAGYLMHRSTGPNGRGVEQIAVHSETGELIKSVPNAAILTDEEFEALWVATNGKGGYTPASGRNLYLLSGILRCAECGTKMSGNRHSNGKNDNVYFYYTCRKGDGTAKTGLGCGKVAASGTALDEIVTDLVLPRIIASTSDMSVDIPRPHVDRLAEIEDEKEGLLLAYRNKEAGSEVIFPEVTRLEQEADGLRREQAEWSKDQRVLSKNVAITPETWESLPTEEKRGYIKQHLEAIYVAKTTKRNGPKFAYDRLSAPVWKQTAGRPDESADTLAAAAR